MRGSKKGRSFQKDPTPLPSQHAATGQIRVQATPAHTFVLTGKVILLSQCEQWIAAYRLLKFVKQTAELLEASLWRKEPSLLERPR